MVRLTIPRSPKCPAAGMPGFPAIPAPPIRGRETGTGRDETNCRKEMRK